MCGRRAALLLHVYGSLSAPCAVVRLQAVLDLLQQLYWLTTTAVVHAAHTCYVGFDAVMID